MAVTVAPTVQSGVLSVSENVDNITRDVAIYATVAMFAHASMRTYRAIWRYVSFSDLLFLIAAATLTVLGFESAVFVIVPIRVPVAASLYITTGVLLWISNIGFLAAPRLLSRWLAECRVLDRWQGDRLAHKALPALITGDVERIEAFLRECARGTVPRYRVVGVLLDDDRLHGSYLHGVQVLGSILNLGGALFQLSEQGLRPQTLILARDNATRRDFEELLDISGRHNIKVGRLPQQGTFQDNTRVRPVELSDLLGRPEIRGDARPVAAMIEGKTVLVTGGGGSIGAELSRQIARLRPASIIVADSCEFNLYSIEQELGELCPDTKRETALIDVRDTELVNRWIERTKPDVVFHAAALKHVPLLEDHPIEAVKTNVFGTVNIAEACQINRVKTLVMVSTDKAVNPSNVMGATKRLAEAYCQGLDQAAGSSRTTRIVSVRFGNVLGSAGSVVPLFQRQIASGGPVTVTHPDITRFFMTIPEAVSLVLQAGAHGVAFDDERGSVYVLEMGQPVKVVDLARQLIRLSGQRPDEDIKLQFIGLRPGEKLYEEVMHHDEFVVPTTTESVMRLAPRITDLRIIRQQVLELRQAVNNADVERVLRLLKVAVPEYSAGPQIRGALS